jgi:hypothetical protein
MTGKRNERHKALDRLADALVEDILNTPDDEILAEFRGDGGDPESHARNMAALFERTLVKANKGRLASAKAGVAAAQNSVISAAPIDLAAARRRLRAVLASPELRGKLTLAARKETEMSDADVVAMLADLGDLGVLPSDEGDQG